jgi:hypothetical protein
MPAATSVESGTFARKGRKGRKGEQSIRAEKAGIEDTSSRRLCRANDLVRVRGVLRGQKVAVCADAP